MEIVDADCDNNENHDYYDYGTFKAFFKAK